MSQPTDVSLEERVQCFHERLKREIKWKLFSGRKDDPEVQIEIAVDEDVFNEGIGTPVHISEHVAAPLEKFSRDYKRWAATKS